MDVPPPPIEKAELVRLVRESMDDALLAQVSGEGDDFGSESSSNPVARVPIRVDLVDPSSVQPEELANHVSDISYVMYLRGHPEYLVLVLNEVWKNAPLSGEQYPPPVCKWVSDILAGPDNSEVMMAAFVTEANAVCGKHLTRNDVAFKCLECGADPTCIICAECFKTSPCQNHDFRMIRSGGGMCDCGDPTAWKQEGFCAKHRGISQTDDPTGAVPSDVSAWMYPCLRAAVRVLVEVIRQFVTRTVSKKWHPMKEEAQSTVTTIAQQLSRLAQFSDCSRRVVVKLLLEPCGEALTNNNHLQDVSSPIDQMCALETLFVLDQRICWFARRNPGAVPNLRWWTTVLSIVKQCVADPFFKTPLARILLKYRELAVADQLGYTVDEEEAEDSEERSSSSRSLESMTSLAVQVFTVPTVVEPLLNPKCLRLGDQCTILDRLVVPVLYGLLVMRDRRSAFPQIEAAGSFDVNHKICPATKESDVFVITHFLVELKYALKSSPAARAYFAMSIVLNKALSVVCRIVSNSGWLCRNPDIVGHILPWHLEGRLVVLTSIVIASCRQCVKRMLLQGAPRAQPPELTNALAMFQEVKYQCLSTVELVLGDLVRPLPFKGELEKALKHVASDTQSGSFASISEPLKLVSALLLAYAAEASGFVAAMMKLSPSGGNVLQGDPMSFTFPSLRVIAMIIRLCLEGHGSSSSNSSVSVVTDEAQLATIVSAAIPSNIEGANWLTVLINPHVVREQHEQSLWKRDFMKIGHHIDLYQRLWKGYAQENDVAMAQLLSVVVPFEMFASTVLERFSYVPPADRLNKKAVPVGYTPFLRYILMIVFDHSKFGRSSLSTDHSSHAHLEHVLRVVLMLTPGGLPRSAIQRELKNFFCDDDGDEDDDGGEGGDLSDAVVSRCLELIATSEQRRDGVWYRLKDVEQFPFINPYTCHLSTSPLQSLLWFEFCKKLSLAKVSEENMAELAPGHLISSSSSPFLQHAALLPSLRRLLHSTAFVNVASFLLISAAFFEHEEVPRTTDEDVFVAVDALWTICGDCLRLSDSLSGNGRIRWETVEATLAADRRACSFASTGPSKLPLGELKDAAGLKRQLQAPISKCDLSILARSSSQKFPAVISACEALLKLREWLLKDVGLKQHTPDPTVPKVSLPHPCESMKREKKLVLLHRATSVLRAVGALAPEDEVRVDPCSGTMPFSNTQSDKSLRAKQRQKELMEKMKAKQAKAVKNLSSASSCAIGTSAQSGGETAMCAERVEKSSIPTTGERNDLHAKCLVDATELECCFCQSTDELESGDYLCFLSHISSSSVLRDVGLVRPKHVSSHAQIDRPWISAHVHFCGHVAHPKCVHRHHQHLASMRGFSVRELLLARRGFRGMGYLGASEFACPLCSRTCTALSAIPRYLNSEKVEDEIDAEENFFREMCSSAQELHRRYPETSPFENFFQSLVNGEIGFSPNTDDNALCDISDIENALKNRIDEGISRAMITSMASEYVALHAASDLFFEEVLLLRAGRPLTLGRYQALLSVIVSLSVVFNASHYECLSALVNDDTNASDGGLVAAILETLHCKQLPLLSIQSVMLRAAQRAAIHLSSNDTTDRTFVTLGALLGMVETASVDHACHVNTWWHTCAAGFLLWVVARSAALNSGGWVSCLFADTLINLDSPRDMRQSLERMFTTVCSENILDEILPLSSCGSQYNFTDQQLLVHSTQTASSFQSSLAEHILHLPQKYNHIITRMSSDASCSACGATKPTKPVICLTCGCLLCLQHPTAPEIYSHARRCGGCSVFLIVRATSFLVLQTVVGRAAQTLSIYVDKYGERDESLFRGAALSLSGSLLQEFIWQWLSCSWDADSAVLEHTWRHHLERL